jgi:hypothetical protein
MATVKWLFKPQDAQFLSSAFPQYVKANGTSFPVTGLYFDAATQENAHFEFKAQNYGSGNLTLNIEWYADTASTNAVVWGAQIACVTPETDTQDIETKAFATAQTVTDTHLGTTGQRIHRCTLTITNLDSIAADDQVYLKFYRDAASGSDTMTGDAILKELELTYSDT